MSIVHHKFRVLLVILFALLPVLAQAADIDRFIGRYIGEAGFAIEGETKPRDLSTTIESTKEGFTVEWTSRSYRSSGKTKENTYKIEFVPSQRPHIFGSAMKTNIFGKQVPLDPLRGEPFVWSRFEADTFTVYSLIINEVGEYELQEYHRTLADGGLDLLFRRVRNGEPQREITAFLKRQ